MTAMKEDRVQLRIEPELKSAFMKAAAFNHQSLSQFLIQSARLGVEDVRRQGSKMKPAPVSRDARKRGGSFIERVPVQQGEAVGEG